MEDVTFPLPQEYVPGVRGATKFPAQPLNPITPLILDDVATMLVRLNGPAVALPNAEPEIDVAVG